MSGAIEFNSFEDFLGYNPGGRVGYFSKWKSSVAKGVGCAVVAMHKQQLPCIVLQHQGIPRLRNREKDGEEVTEIWGGEWVCWQDKTILEFAGRASVKLDPAGKAHWPHECALCRLDAHVAEQVYLAERERKAAEKAKREIDLSIGLPFWTPLFRISSPDSPDDEVVYAGALVGMLPAWKDLGDEAKRYVKKSGLEMGADAWNKKNLAKAVTLFTITGVALDADGKKALLEGGILPDFPVGDGLLVAQETDMLREKVADEASKSIRRLKEAGNPWHRPYPFLWEFDKNADRIWEMYSATALPNVTLPPEVLALITGPVPDLSRRKRPHNQATMRAYLEQHAERELPWDLIYSVPKLSDGAGDDDFPYGANAPAESAAPEVGREQPPPAAAAGVRTPAEPPTTVNVPEWKLPREQRGAFPQKDDPAGEDVIAACTDGKQGCGKLMWIEDHTCPHCGHVWDSDKKAAEEKAKAAAAPARTPRARGGTAKPALDPLPPPREEGKKGQQVGGDKIGFA
jgi:hypothetical protein